MSPPAPSLAYKLAKRHLAARPWKYSIAFCLVVAFVLPPIVDGIVSGYVSHPAHGDFFSVGDTYAAYRISGILLSAAFYAWLLRGYRQIIEEQAKLLEEARAK